MEPNAPTTIGMTNILLQFQTLVILILKSIYFVYFSTTLFILFYYYYYYYWIIGTGKSKSYKSNLNT